MRFTLQHSGSSSLAGQSRTLEQLQVSLGRDPSNNIQFDPVRDRGISRFHGTFQVKGSQLFYQDLGSTGGSSLNGQPVRGKVLVRDRDVLQLGPSGAQIQVAMDDPSVPTARYAGPQVMRAGLYVTLYAGGVLGLIVCLVLATDRKTQEASAGIPFFLLVVGATHMTLIYRMWSALQGRGARMTPWGAVLGLLVPVFNLYWLFQVFPGFATDFNRCAERSGSPARVSNRLLRAFGVLQFLPPIGVLLEIPLVLSVSRAINRLGQRGGASVESQRPVDAPPARDPLCGSQRDGSIESYLDAGEQLLMNCDGRQRPPFLLRILPFIPDLLTRGKRFQIALTDRRVLVFRMTNPFNRLAEREVKELQAAVDLHQIDAVIPVTGPLTSTLIFESKSAGRQKYTDLLQSEASRFAELFQQAATIGRVRAAS